MRVVLFWLLVSYQLLAHQTGLSYLKLVQIDAGKVDLLYKKPLEDSQAKDITINYPATCFKSHNTQVVIKNGFILERSQLTCGQNNLKGLRIWIEGLVRSDKGIIVSYQNGQTTQSQLLRASRPFLYIEESRSLAQITVEYTKLGFYHILTGYDHLLFLLALMLLVPNFRILIYSISAFTLSHSITLVLSIFDIIIVPAIYVESMIALSIIIFYREIIVANTNTLSSKHLPWMVFFFGLLHGLGFASVLQAIGLPQNEIIFALLAFNIGIELGQLLFVMTLLQAYWVLRYFLKAPLQRHQNLLKASIAYIFGTLATLWMLERVMAF